MAGQMPGDLNEVGNHSAQPSSPDMALVPLLVLQRFLPNHAEQIIGYHRQLKHQSVRVELAGREALDVHVGLQFTVILLAFAMRVVRFNDCVISPVEIRPPHVDFDVWQHIMQIRPSGLRVKPGTYFPALVAITQTSIVGKRKRYLTPRECARLQSFPDTFIYDDKNPQAYKQFGNSINVALVRLFAQYMFGDKDVQHKYSYEVQFGKEDEEPNLFSGMFDD